MLADYLYIKRGCINLDGRTAIVGSTPVKLTKASKAILEAVIAGAGRLDVLAGAAAGPSAARWARDFAAAVESSQLIGIHRVSERAWPARTPLVCDWCGEAGARAASGAKLLRWVRDPEREVPRRIRLGGGGDLCFEAQILRGMLGATSGRRLLLIGAADRILLGDLIHRHRASVIVSQDWPHARRVWQHASEVLREDRVWLEHLYYAIRNCDETSASELSARSGTVMAAQEARALCDAHRVYCWSRAQQKELVRFYGRTEAATPILVQRDRGTRRPPPALSQAVGFILRSNGRG